MILPAIKDYLLPICANLRHFGDIRNIYVEPYSKIKKHIKILRNSYNLKPSDFKTSLLSNLSLNFKNFELYFL